MKRKLLSILAVCCLLLSLAACGQQAETADKPATQDLDLSKPLFSGSGTQQDPYLIGTADDLAMLSQVVNSNSTHLEHDQSAAVKAYLTAFYQVTQDIDMSGRDFAPIGDGYKDSVVSFAGCFDGQGHRISGLSVSIGQDSDISCVGLFGNVDKEGVIKNLVIADSVFHVDEERTASSYVGAVAGRCYGSIENCTTEASVSFTGTPYQLGGIVGVTVLQTGRIMGCTNQAAVTSLSTVGMAGGIVGFATKPVIDCENLGAVSSGDTAGGIAGTLQSGENQDFALTSCRNSGSVTITADGNYAGGIVGKLNALNTNSASLYTTLSDCVNTGTVTGTDAGGIAAWITMSNSTVLVENCTNEGETLALAQDNSKAGGIAAGFLVQTDTGALAFRNCKNTGAISHGDNPDDSDLVITTAGIVGSMQLSGLTPVTLENCINEGNIYSRDWYAGGIAAEASSDIISKSQGVLKLHFVNCKNTGVVDGSAVSGLGGILSSYHLLGNEAEALKLTHEIVFEGCENTGKLFARGAGAAAGGIAGFLDGKLLENILIKDCSNSGDLETEAASLNEFDKTQDYCVFHGGMVGFIGNKTILFDRNSNCGITDVRIHLENNTNSGKFIHPDDGQQYLTDDGIAFTPLPH